MRNEVLPSDLGAAFTVASARGAGLTRAEIGSSAFITPFHGIRAVAPFDLETLTAREAHLQRIHAYACAMGAHEFISHVSAAVLWQVPLPAWGIGSDIDVSVWLPHRSPRGRGVRGHAVAPHLVTVVAHSSGVNVSSPASTWATLGAVLRHPYDLIAAGDALVRVPQHPNDPPAAASIVQLDAAVNAGRRVGVAALRAALDRVRVGASSHPETWTRLTLVDAGLPEPVLAFEALDSRGEFIARIDLAYPHWKIAIEYEGEHHFTDPEQSSRDILRYERLAAEGWLVIRITKDELFTRPRSVADRVRRAIALAA